MAWLQRGEVRMQAKRTTRIAQRGIQMISRLSISSILVALTLLGSHAFADATFTFDLSEPDGRKTVKNIAIWGFWARVDDPSEAQRFVLYQAGKFFPMYSVDEAQQTYALLTKPREPFISLTKIGWSKNAPATSPQVTDGESGTGRAKLSAESEPAVAAAAPTSEEPIATPGAAQNENAVKPVIPSVEHAATAAPSKPEGRFQHPELKATKKSRTVAGMRCRIVLEMVAGEPVIEHCMATTARLRVTHRELITLARLFVQARKMNLGWLGIGTEDERFVSIHSRDLNQNRTLALTSVSTKPLPAGHLRIPRNFKRLESGAPEAGTAGEG